jgi:hypothetical protein
MKTEREVELAQELEQWRQTAVQNGELATKYRTEILELRQMLAQASEEIALHEDVCRENITERICQPSPDQIREARERAKLTQTQAAGLVSSAAGYKTWSGYEQPVGTRNHRAISLATWELFLLLTNQHPTMRLKRGASTGESGE